jgi:hypothetical protein
MGDAASGYLRTIGKNKVGYIMYALDIAPACDCVPGSDTPIIPNIGVFASRDIVAIDVAALDKSVEAYGIQGSMAEEKEVMNPGDEKFTGIYEMSQWVSANTCEHHNAGSKEYELLTPLVSEDESAFCHPWFSPEKPSSYYLAKGLKKVGTWVPPGGFNYNEKPLRTIKELSKR